MNLRSAFLFLILPVFAFSQNSPPAFKGIPFGVDATTFLSLYKPGGRWGERGGVPQVSFDEGRRAVVIQPPNSSGVVSGQMYSVTLKDSVANVDADLVLFFAIQNDEDVKIAKSGVTRALASRALFYEVFASFDRRTFDHVYAATCAKYGEPTTINEKRRVWDWDLSQVFLRLDESYMNTGKMVLTIKAKSVKSLSVSSAAAQL